MIVVKFEEGCIRDTLKILDVSWLHTIMIQPAFDLDFSQYQGSRLGNDLKLCLGVFTTLTIIYQKAFQIWSKLGRVFGSHVLIRNKLIMKHMSCSIMS